MPAPRLHNATELSTLDEKGTLFCGKFVVYAQNFSEIGDFFWKFHMEKEL